MNKEEILKIIPEFQRLIEYIYPIFNQYIEISEGYYNPRKNDEFTLGTSYLKVGSIHFKDDTIVGEGDHYSYGELEYFEYEMPISFLWDLDFENLKKNREQFLQDQIIKQKEHDAALDRWAEESERLWYITLHEKYGEKNKNE